jgi:hypothetical protein
MGGGERKLKSGKMNKQVAGRIEVGRLRKRGV